MGLIIPVEYLNRELPQDATDESGALTNAITEASAFCNTWAHKYLEFEAYDEDSDDEYTINAPNEVVYICKQVAKHMYWMNVGDKYRDGAEGVDHEARLEYYRKMLQDLNVEPTRHSTTISLDSEGYQLIDRSPYYNILTHNAYVTSASSNVWNFGVHWRIVKGNVLDNDDYYHDGWYLDASSDTSVEGTLYYYRTYRNDGKDYMRTFSDIKYRKSNIYG